MDKEGYFEKDATFMLKDSFETNKVFGDNATWIQGIATSVPDTKSLKYKRTSNVSGKDELAGVEEETLDFDYLVVASGATYIANEQGVEDLYHNYSKESRKSFIDQYAQKIEEAQSVLIVGGGATGCEHVGELILQYGSKKKIGLMHGTPSLLPGYPAKAGEKAKKCFEDRGVKVYLNQKFDPNGEEAKEYDFVIRCIGTYPCIPFFENDTYNDCKDQRGRIYVNQLYQVTNQNPLLPPSKQINKDVKVYDNIFAHGDACLTSMNEPKNIVAIQESSAIIGYNLKQTLKANPKFKEIGIVLDDMAGLYLAGDFGVVIVNDFVAGQKNILKMKYDTQNFIMDYLAGKPKGEKNYNSFQGKKHCVLCCCNNICCLCCPCSKRKRKANRKKELRQILSSAEP